jgi:maleylacetoacetate isomerase
MGDFNNMMILYGFSYSGSAYRVRIALNAKGIRYEQRSIHPLRDGGAQHAPEYRRLSPNGVMPTLVHGDVVLTQSGAILEYLEQTHPTPPLLPPDPAEQAWVRSVAQTFGVDSHPLVTIRVIQHLESHFGIAPERRFEWARHWLAFGLQGAEALLRDGGRSRRFCHGDDLTHADIYLVPHVLAALRHKIAIADYPIIDRIYRNCLAHPAVADADPERQPDAADADAWRVNLDVKRS